MKPEPINKVLPFKHRDPLPCRWQCPPPCHSTTFTLWDDGKVYCAHCYGHHWRIYFTVDENAVEPGKAS